MDNLSTLPAASLPQTDPSQQAAILEAAKKKAGIHEAAVKFEAMYMNEMFNHMFAGLETNGPFSGGHGEEIFRSMMVDQYAQITAKSGQTKIAQTMERAMLQMQEQQANPRGIPAVTQQ